jgi:hypothetical protein
MSGPEEEDVAAILRGDGARSVTSDKMSTLKLRIYMDISVSRDSAGMKAPANER